MALHLGSIRVFPMANTKPNMHQEVNNSCTFVLFCFVNYLFSFRDNGVMFQPLMFLYLKSAIIYRAIFKAVFFSILLE
jgi:hypothetical protein